MTRLDAASLRKRSAVRGDMLVEVKPGDAVLGVTEEWALERYVVVGKKEDATKKVTPRKVAAKKTPVAEKKVATKKTPVPAKKVIVKKTPVKNKKQETKK
jgi:hypothetical protein